MRKLLHIIIASAAIGMIVSSCQGNGNKNAVDSARSLYERSVKMLNQYSDSVKNAKDSATFERLIKQYESEITKLNYEYPADTQINMSEGENDTLTNLTLRYIAIRDSIKYRINHPVLSADTIKPDSTTNK